MWFKAFKNGPNKICGKQPLKKLKWHGLPKQTTSKIFLGPFLNTLTRIMNAFISYLKNIYIFTPNSIKYFNFTLTASNSASIYLLSASNANIKKMSEIYAKLAIKTSNANIVLVSLMLTLNGFHVILVFPLRTLNK